MHYSIKYIASLIFVIEVMITVESNCQHAHLQVIPASANSWVISDVFHTSKVITEQGITKWSDSNHIIRTFFHVEKAGEISVSINARVASGTSEIEAKCKDASKKISISNTSFHQLPHGNIPRKGKRLPLH